MRRGDGIMTSTGSLSVRTGKYTGRSTAPKVRTEPDESRVLPPPRASFSTMRTRAPRSDAAMAAAAPAPP